MSCTDDALLLFLSLLKIYCKGEFAESLSELKTPFQAHYSNLLFTLKLDM